MPMLDSVTFRPELQNKINISDSQEEKGTLSFSPDLRIHPTTNTTQSEMSIAVHPSNPNIILVGANTSDYPVTTIYGTGWYISADGGYTWRGSDIPPTGYNHGDPAAAIDINGFFYIGSIASDFGQGIIRSIDGGLTWEYFTVSSPPASGILDKNHLHVDNSISSPYKGYLYVGWTNFGKPSPYPIEITKSTDHGNSWSQPVVVSNGLQVNSSGFHQGVNIQTGPNGEVYVVWAVYTSWPDVERKIGFNKSFNGGETWEGAKAIIEDIKGIRTSAFGPYGIRANSFPSMAVDNSNGPYRGRIYVTWTNVGVPGENLGDPDIYLIHSDDNGVTWSSPIRVNDDPINNGAYQWFPWVAVDQHTGVVYVIFYDGRNFIGDNKAEIYVAYSTNGGFTFTNICVSDETFVVGPLPGFKYNYNGDYIGIASFKGQVYPVWNSQMPEDNSQAWISPFSTGIAAAEGIMDLTPALMDIDNDGREVFLAKLSGINRKEQT